jgi:hypothetical protein
MWHHDKCYRAAPGLDLPGRRHIHDKLPRALWTLADDAVVTEDGPASGSSCSRASSIAVDRMLPPHCGRAWMRP